jgi:chorismate mutase/prephenate dehydratase
MTRIAYLGPEHTNTHLAARKRFGRRANYVHSPTVEDVFHQVERRQVDYGVVPIENSLEGAVTHTLDRFVDFRDTPVRIYGEIDQSIQHCLILRPSSSLKRVSIVYSHPQALAQCRGWLKQYLPHSSLGETDSTAEAVDYVLDRKHVSRIFIYKPRERAAIARRELAVEHKLKFIPIPQERENRTRFLVVSLGESPKGRRNKTSVLFALKDRPGALHDALVPFKRHRINLTKIESRPSKQKAWEYLFFIDLEGHQSEPRLTRALRALKANTSLMRVLGSYPALAR